MANRILAVLAVLLAGMFLHGVASETGYFAALMSTVHMGRQPGGVVLLAANQLVRPAPREHTLAGRPVDAAMDGSTDVVAVLNTRGVALLDAATLAPVGEIRTSSTSYAGVAFRPGAGELWASETARSGGDALLITTIGKDRRPVSSRRVLLEGHPVPTGIAFSSDGTAAYVALSRNNSLAVFDGSGVLRREIPVGMAPFGVAVSEKSKRIFVTNRAGRRPGDGDTKGPTSGAEVITHAKTGAAVSGTLSVIEMGSNQSREIPVGLAPSTMALSPSEKLLMVANGHSDSVTIVDTATLKTEEVKIPAFPEGSFGSQPVAGAFSEDEKTLYVACAGTNSIAALHRGQPWKAAGFYPVGFFPTAVIRDEASLVVVNLKGLGNTLGSDGRHNSRNYAGSVQRFTTPGSAALPAGTREVKAANQPRFTPAGGVQDLEKLGIQHVFFIIKENRTYDQVLSDIPKGERDPKLLHYGRDVTPNHHALAERYVLLDNFYTSGAISFDGHHWLTQAFVSDYVERAFAASPRGYAWNLSDALVISPAGFFWQSARRPLGVRIYSEFCLPARWDPVKQQAIDMNEGSERSWSEYWQLYRQDKWREAVGSRSGIPALQPYINPRSPHNNVNIPDQIRAEAFLEDFRELEKKGGVPNLSILTLNSDHTNGTRPGSPTPRAMVADNDLALGRIVEALSKSPIWPQTLILVTEDDAQNGLDHVHGYRTIGLAIGPHVVRGKLDSNHYNHTSMVRTIQAIFGIPPASRALRSARVMASVFQPEGKPETFKALTPQVALDEMNPPLKALRGRQLWAARESAAMNWKDIDDVPHDVLNRILWWDAKGWNTPFPELAWMKTPRFRR